jgi:hypothetical protein
MDRFRSELVAAAALAACLTGCGGVSFKTPHDHVTFIFNGERTTIAMSGTISVQIDGVPRLSYSGPAGCAGHYFADDDADTYFRYTPSRAFLLRGNQLYTFNQPPHKLGGDIAWGHNFGSDKVTVLANCPIP